MEPLGNPLSDRVVKEVEPPPSKPLADRLLFPQGNQIPDCRILKRHMQKEGRVSKQHCVDIVKSVSAVTSCEPNLLQLTSPITVVGDIHGQFYDLIKLLDISGDPETTRYLFLGDYVDRGSFSIEVLLLLYALKLNQPKNIWLLRGNHECRQLTAFFNFRDECEHKYDLSVYYAFMESFDTFPVAAVVDNKFLCVHGGLSPDMTSLGQLGLVNRFQEPPRTGLLCDLLWADPIDEEKMIYGEACQTSEGYLPNDVRGCSFFFSYGAAIQFLAQNQLLSVIRAHEAQLEGFKMHQTNPQNSFPTVITIFSAPNYCDCYNNKGAVLKLENNSLNIQQFHFSPHPYHLPNFMNLFTWSMPFVFEKVTEMLYTILKPSSFDDSDLDDNDVDMESKGNQTSLFSNAIQFPNSAVVSTPNPQAPSQLAAVDSAQNEHSTSALSGALSSLVGPHLLTRERAETLRGKVRTVARILRVFRTLRQQHNLIVQLKGVTPAHRIPPGALLGGEQALKNELDKFLHAKHIDSVNERRPDK